MNEDYTYKFPLGKVIEDNGMSDTSDAKEGKYKPATPFRIKTSDEQIKSGKVSPYRFEVSTSIIIYTI